MDKLDEAETILAGESAFEEVPLNGSHKHIALNKDDDMSLNHDSWNKSPADSQQANKIENHRNSIVFCSKRKLNSTDEEDEELAESGKKALKRSHGKYNFRNLSTSSSTGNIIDKKRPNDKNGWKKSKKHNTSRNEDGIPGKSDTETEMELKEEIEYKEFQNKDVSASNRQDKHNDKILKKLNEGSLEELKSLSRVGPKTAKMLYEYRDLHGKLESIGDLAKMSGWTPKFFQQFLSANNITLD